MAQRALALVGLACGGVVVAQAHASASPVVSMILIMVAIAAMQLWFQPRMPTVAAWGMVVWVSGVLLLVSLEHKPHAGWLDALFGLGLCGLPVAGYAVMAALSDRPIRPPSQLARKLRSVAVVAFMVSVVVAVLAFLPGVSSDDGARTVAAGGLPVAMAIALIVGPGIVVYANPTRANGWRWAMFGLAFGAPCAALMLIASLWVRRSVELWPMHAVELGLGTLVTMIVVVQSIVLLATRGDDDPGPTTLPPARAVR